MSAFCTIGFGKLVTMGMGSPLQVVRNGMWPLWAQLKCA